MGHIYSDPAQSIADRISGSVVRMRCASKIIRNRVAPNHGCQPIKQSAEPARRATVWAVTLFLVCNLAGREIYSRDVSDDVDRCGWSRALTTSVFQHPCLQSRRFFYTFLLRGGVGVGRGGRDPLKPNPLLFQAEGDRCVYTGPNIPHFDRSPEQCSL